MGITTEQRSKATRDRFQRWGQFLGSQNATPILMVGLTGEDDLVITTIEDMSDKQISDLLVVAIRMMARGQHEQAKGGRS
jgi:hypothetical protein